MHTLQQTHSRLQKEFQNEGKHNGKDDRACQVERRKDAQCKNATEKECLRIRWQRHLRLNIRRHSLGLRRAIVRDGRQGGWDAPVAERQQPRVLPPNVRKTASMMSLAEREGTRHRTRPTGIFRAKSGLHDGGR